MMKWFNILMARLRALFRRESVLRDIEEELRAHIETETDIKRGMASDEARAAALKSFGDLVRNTERGYDIRGGGWLETLWQDLRYGLRMMSKKPGFTLLAVTTLALGVGVNTALFTGFNLLFRPKPIKDPDTVVKLDHSGGAYGLFSYPDYVAFRERAQTISEWLPSFGERFLLGEAAAGVEPEEIGGSFVSENYLSTLGGGVQIGRFFTAEENRVAGRDAVVVLSHQFWQRSFAGNPQIVGQSLQLDGKPFTVIGVANPAFVGLHR